jgi:CO/xanthine dehydrogenase FAD-binding subunit
MPTWLAPSSLEEALAVLADEPAEILAGGTDLWPKWSSGQPRPERVLSLHRIGGALRRISLEEGVLRIGAACSHSDLGRSPEVRRACPALAEAALTIGAIQIQNQGTIGGNLANASPAADLPPPLCAAGAEVELCSRRGARRLPLRKLYLGYRKSELQPDELLVAIHVPALPARAREGFRKVGTRRAQAIAKVAVACRLALAEDGSIEGAGIALGSVGPTVVQLDELGLWLTGRAADRETALGAEARAREAVQPIDDLRSSADYRRHVVGRLVHNFILGL